LERSEEEGEASGFLFFSFVLPAMRLSAAFDGSKREGATSYRESSARRDAVNARCSLRKQCDISFSAPV
jgi:hypothetical protein